jgi:hypothetical protein
MNGYQFMLIMNDLMMDIKLGMRLTNPNKGLSRLKSQYKSMLGLPRNAKNRTLFIALYENVLEVNRDKFTESFVLSCQDFYEDLFTAEFND